MNPEYSQLLIDIQKKSNITVKNTRDLKFLKEEIESLTHKVIGFNTLRRIFGFLESRTPSVTTLNTLANFLGFASFSGYQHHKLNYEEWYFQQSLNRIIINEEITKKDFDLINYGLLNQHNFVYLAYFIVYFIEKKDLKSVVSIFRDVNFNRASGTQLHKFSQIISVRLSVISEKDALEVYEACIPIDSFREYVALPYINYYHLYSRYFRVLELIEIHSANSSDILFVDCMKFYRDYYILKKSNLKPPKKPDGFSDLYSVLKGRYYGSCILASGELDLKLKKEILNECKNNRVSYFLEEVVPALLVIQEYDFLTLLFENYYEDIFEFGVWSSSTTQSIYLVALSWLNCEKNELKIARKNLEFVQISRVEISYEKYIRLFYQFILLQLTFKEEDKKANKLASSELKSLVSETKFSKFQEISSSYLL
ncbi:MAG: hypothetical protein ABF264_06150 [Flavobacteriales bacterium]|jgi:hypothetical protein